MTDGFEVNYVQPNRRALVVLQRCSDAPRPDYIVFGKTMCYRCQQWCWLGSETLQVVNSGSAMPFCVECAGPLCTEATRIDQCADEGWT